MDVEAEGYGVAWDQYLPREELGVGASPVRVHTLLYSVRVRPERDVPDQCYRELAPDLPANLLDGLVVEVRILPLLQDIPPPVEEGVLLVEGHPVLHAHTHLRSGERLSVRDRARSKEDDQDNTGEK